MTSNYASITTVNEDLQQLLAMEELEIDWWTIPDDQRIISDDILDWITPEAEQIFQNDYLQEMAKENMPPASKRHKKTEQYSKVAVTCSISLQQVSKGFVPSNTRSNTDWAVKSFLYWAEWRKDDNDPVPKDFFTLSDSVAINKWLSLFIIEVRKKDGSRFPNSSLTLLLCGIKRYMKDLNPDVPNFLDEEDSRFIETQLHVVSEQKV